MTSPTIAKACARHRDMVLDPYRTPSLKTAIEAAIRPGDTVVDVGCGIGVLSFFAIQRGARHIHAIDCDKAALSAAKFFAKKCRVADKITFYDKLSFDCRLPEKADVLVCEIVGSLAFEENFLSTLIDARKRLLKPGGRIVPQRIELWSALADERARYQGWSDVAGLDLREGSEPFLDWKAIPIKPEWLLSDPERLAAVDTLTSSKPRVEARKQFAIKRKGILGGICLWPKITWWEDIVTDASPFLPPTHWRQGFLPIAPRPCATQDRVGIHVRIEPKQGQERTATDILWKLEDNFKGKSRRR